MRRRDLLLWPLAVAAAAGGALLILHANPIGLLVGCPLRVWTGLPCPTCGGTHAVRELLDGRLLGALVPAVTAVVVGGIALQRRAWQLPRDRRHGPPPSSEAPGSHVRPTLRVDVEVTPEGERVWEFVNFNLSEEREPSVIVRMRRYEGLSFDELRLAAREGRLALQD